MKKQDQFYFDNFVECTDCALRAARLLQDTMKNFDPAKIKEDMDKMHDIEHEADTKKHEMLGVLMKAFMTPIEREDIMLLSSCLDEVTDKIEDVVLRMYCNNIHYILPAAIDMARIVVDSCEEMVCLPQSTWRGLSSTAVRRWSFCSRSSRTSRGASQFMSTSSG